MEKPIQQKLSSKYITRIVIVLCVISILGFLIFKIMEYVKNKKNPIKNKDKSGIPNKLSSSSYVEELNNPEVFLVKSNNNKNFKKENTEEICKIFNSELATYDQLVTATTNGAHWCEYGWIKGGKEDEDENKNKILPYYPMQKKGEDLKNCIDVDTKSYVDETTYKIIKGNEAIHTNEGNVKAVNCYGVKPKMTQKHLDMLKLKNLKLEKEQNKELKEKSEFKNKILKSGINSFNTDIWSRYRKNKKEGEDDVCDDVCDENETENEN
jgi:hypothetical protein